MIKDVIKYKDKEYQLSTVKVSNVFETMIFPVENEIVYGNEVYCFRTTRAGSSHDKHQDIYENPEKYLSEKAIEKYLACRDCSEWCCTMCKYFG